MSRPPKPSKLVDDWLWSVNQPVVNSVCETVTNLLREISDGGNFTRAQCVEILTHIIASCPDPALKGPEKKSTPALKGREGSEKKLRRLSKGEGLEE